MRRIGISGRLRLRAVPTRRHSRSTRYRASVKLRAVADVDPALFTDWVKRRALEGDPAASASGR
jgi:hypothetical protein